jgi:hypothetical protein
LGESGGAVEGTDAFTVAEQALTAALRTAAAVLTVVVGVDADSVAVEQCSRAVQDAEALLAAFVVVAALAATATVQRIVVE